MKKELDKIINSLPNGITDNFVFFASNSFKNKLESYKEVRIFYSNLIEDGLIYYCEDFFNK